MNSTLNRRFIQIRGSNPEIGDYIALCMAVQYKGYKRRDILYTFKTYVSKNEYEKKDIEQLMEYLIVQSFKTEKVD